MRTAKGLLIVAIVVLTGLSILVWSLMPQPIPVETARITEHAFQSSFSEDGKTRLRNRYTISAPFTGTLLRPRLKAGDTVEQGDVVATLYSAPSPLLDARLKAELQERIGVAEANIEEATTLMESARMEYAQALKEFERVKSLNESGTATRQQLDRSQLAKDVAERSQIAAEKRRHAAEHVLEQVRQLSASFEAVQHNDEWTVKAPISGIVVKIFQESEGIVASGSPLLDIGDLKDLEIVADILTPDVATIKPGQRVIIDKWGGPGPLEGRVRRVEPAAITKISALGIEEQRTPILIDIVSPFDLWKNLGDQYRVNVRVITYETDSALIIPASAIFHRTDGDYTFVVRNNVAQLQKIDIGQRGGSSATLLSGLNKGDEVIIYPPRELENGKTITRRNSE